MNRATITAGAALVLFVAWWVASGSPNEERPEGPSARVAAGDETMAVAGGPVSLGAVGREPKAGFPSMGGAREDRSWRAIVWRQIGEQAERLGGDGWNEAGRERLMVALTELRDAEHKRERARSEPDPEKRIEAARQQRAAALAADEISRELFGLPLTVFLQRVDPGAAEEVPTG